MYADLKKEALDVFFSALYKLNNNPFGKINNSIIEDIIEFEIYQKLGKKTLKKYNNNLSTIQINIITSKIDEYKYRVSKKLKNKGTQKIGQIVGES